VKMSNVLLVYKKSTFELYNSSPDAEVRDYINSSDPNALSIRKSHECQKRSFDSVVKSLDELGIKHEAIYRAGLSEITGRDLVISLGGDGTFLEVSHYVKSTPMLGVNSDPGEGGSVGYFCCATADNFSEVMKNIGRAPITRLNRLELILEGKNIPEMVLNDIMVAHTNPVATTMCDVVSDGKQFRHKGYGFLVSTAAGSTGSMYCANGIVMPLDSDKIEYIGLGIRGSRPDFATELDITSLTRQAKIYIDGQHLSYDFTLGNKLHVKNGLSLDVVGDLGVKRSRFSQ